MDNITHILICIAGFSIIALASRQIGDYFVRAKLPLISGFLFTGIIAGPYLLNLIPLEATEKLRFIDEMALAVIAFAAGSELYLKDLRSRLRSISWIMLGNAFFIPLLGGITIFVLADNIAFMRVMPPSGKIAVALLAGAILVARSPSSAIAIVRELRAKGSFTQTVLGVTMLTDVIVIALFAVCSSVADSLLHELNFDPDFVGFLMAELIFSIILGLILAKLLTFILSLRIPRALKTGFVLLAGYGVFIFSAYLRVASHNILPFDLLLEPLLICMIGGFATANLSHHRSELLKILHDIGPPVYIAFFTLTGASLALDVLGDTWTIALALFGVRIFAIFIGSFSGGALAGDPMRHNKLSWMAYITQAGVGLGLAKEVVVEFPDWGGAFATIIISVIVLSQIIGPPLFKLAIQLNQEAHPRAETGSFDGVRDALIFGLEGQSIALARLLRSHDWEVIIVCTDESYILQSGKESDIAISQIAEISLSKMKKLGAGNAEAIVCMLSDEENYQICEMAYEHFGTKNLIVRLNNRANFKRFHELGALIVDPTTAIVSLLDHFVRSPAAASLLLGMEQNQDVIEFQLLNPDLHGMAIRDLRLPLDIHILSVRRRGHELMSHGYTRLELGDWLTVVGSVASLEQMMLHFDVNREVDVLDLVKKVTPPALTTSSFSNEVEEIIRDKEHVRRDRFNRLIEEGLVLDIEAAVSLESFFTSVAEKMAPLLDSDPNVLYQLLVDREREASTAFSPYFAIPHIIIEGEHTFRILLARCKAGITFSELAPRVQAVFVLIGTKDERNYHLHALSTIAEIVKNPNFYNRWLRARGKNALRRVVMLDRERILRR